MKHFNYTYGDRFVMKCSPLNHFLGISFTSSSDEMVEQECTLEKYWADDTLTGEFPPYKVKLVSIDPRYSNEKFYWSDFLHLLEQGVINKK